MLLFTYVFGGAISHSLPAGVSYIDYLLPGILIQSVTFRASMTAIGLSDDLKLGVIDRFRSMPMARSAVLIGRTVADLVRNVLIVVLMIIVGYIIGFRFQAGVAQAVACIALVSAFGLALSWIFAFVAFTVRSAEAAQSAGFVILFPLVFASSVFVPVSSMPSWLQAFAQAKPGHPDRERSPLPCPAPRDAILARRRSRLDRRPAGRVHSVVRVAVPAHDLTPPTTKVATAAPARGGIDRVSWPRLGAEKRAWA